MRSFCLLVAFGAAISSALAQQSFFQSSDGQSAIYLRQSASAVTFGDSKASIGYIHRINTDRYSWGAEGYATANTGVTSLFSSDKPKAPEGGGDFTVVRHYNGQTMEHATSASANSSNSENFLLIDAGYGRSSFYLYPTGSKPSTSTAKTNFDRFRTIVAYNLFSQGNSIWGLAAGAERRNNISDLKATNLQTTIVAGPPGTSSSIVKTQAGYYGSYKEHIAAAIYGDYLYFFRKKFSDKLMLPGLENRLGIDALVRADVAAPNRGAKGGLGIFLFKKEDPLTPIGGLTATYNGTKVQVSLTTGFSLSK